MKKDDILNNWNLTIADIGNLVERYGEGLSDIIDCQTLINEDYPELIDTKSVKLIPPETLLFISCIDLNLFIDEIRTIVRTSNKYCFNDGVSVQYFPIIDTDMKAGCSGYYSLFDFLEHHEEYIAESDSSETWNEKRYNDFLTVFVNAVNKTYQIKVNWWCVIDRLNK